MNPETLFILGLVIIAVSAAPMMYFIKISCEDSIISKCENFTEYKAGYIQHRSAWAGFWSLWSWEPSP